MTASSRLVDYLGRGLAAGLPTPADLTLSASTAALYWATDTETLYLMNQAGTAWETLVIPSGLSVTDGTHTESAVTTLTFSGAVVSSTGAGEATVTIAAGGSLSVGDGTTTETDVTTLTFSGATVTSSGAGEATVTISGGGGGGGSGGNRVAYAVGAGGTTSNAAAGNPPLLIPGLTTTFTLAESTDVSIRVAAWYNCSGSNRPRIEFIVDGSNVTPVAATGTDLAPIDQQELSIEMTLAAGTHTVEGCYWDVVALGDTTWVNSYLTVDSLAATAANPIVDGWLPLTFTGGATSPTYGSAYKLADQTVTLNDGDRIEIKGVLDAVANNEGSTWINGIGFLQGDNHGFLSILDQNGNRALLSLSGGGNTVVNYVGSGLPAGGPSWPLGHHINIQTSYQAVGTNQVLYGSGDGGISGNWMVGLTLAGASGRMFFLFPTASGNTAAVLWARYRIIRKGS